MRIKKVTSDVGNKIASSTLAMLIIGVLLTIWGGIWLAYLLTNGADTEAWYYVSTGVLLSGLVIGLVGFFSGRISRAANEPAEGEHSETVTRVPANSGGGSKD